MDIEMRASGTVIVVKNMGCFSPNVIWCHEQHAAVEQKTKLYRP